MKRPEGLFLFIALAVIFPLAGCEKLNLNLPGLPTFQPEGTVVAKVNDIYITLDQLNQEIDNINALAAYYKIEPKKFTTEEKITFLKESLVPKILFYKEARARGLDKQAKIKESLLNVQIQVLYEQFIKQQAADLTATPQEIEGYYNLYKDQFRQQEERRVREIVGNTEEEAKEILIDLLKGSEFASLAQQRSKAESAAKGGDLGFIKKGQRGEDYKRFDEVAFSPSLEIGQISTIFKDKKGYFILRLDGSRGGQTTPLNEVWDQVKETVLYYKQQQKIQDLRDSLSKKAKIEIYQEKVK
jgi:peptidyl-prolyl cis-trans isomerase C